MKGAIERRLARVLNRAPVKLKKGTGCVAISFDDVPVTACGLGAEILERHGARGTYYVSGSFETDAADRDPARFHTSAQLKDLHARGHEIGCHGFDHLHYQALSDQDMAEDIAKNRRYFQQTGLPEATTFAYPYGSVSPGVKRVCAGLYPVCRGITAGINQRVMDRTLLSAVPLYDTSWSAEQSDRLLARVQQEGGLLVFFTHGVEDQPGPFDCSPQLLEQTVKMARQRGLDIRPVQDAVQYVSAEP